MKPVPAAPLFEFKEVREMSPRAQPARVAMIRTIATIHSNLVIRAVIELAFSAKERGPCVRRKGKDLPLGVP
jgi:hypothetical protein